MFVCLFVHAFNNHGNSLIGECMLRGWGGDGLGSSKAPHSTSFAYQRIHKKRDITNAQINI